MSGAMMKQCGRNLVLFTALIFLACSVWSESKAQGQTSKTVAFSHLPQSPIPQMFQIAGVTFLANCVNSGVPKIMDHGSPTERGYTFLPCGVTIVLPIEAMAIELRLCQFADSEFTIEALDSAGSSIKKRSAKFQNGCGEVAIDGGRISTIRVMGAVESSIVWLKFS